MFVGALNATRSTYIDRADIVIGHLPIVVIVVVKCSRNIVQICAVGNRYLLLNRRMLILLLLLLLWRLQRWQWCLQLRRRQNYVIFIVGGEAAVIVGVFCFDVAGKCVQQTIEIKGWRWRILWRITNFALY